MRLLYTIDKAAGSVHSERLEVEISRVELSEVSGVVAEKLSELLTMLATRARGKECDFFVDTGVHPVRTGVYR
jgi:hypothetical protein